MSNCIICNTDSAVRKVKVTEWLIKDGEPAVLGKEKMIHSTCLDKKLYIEDSGEDSAFVYGRIPLYKRGKYED